MLPRLLFAFCLMTMAMNIFGACTSEDASVTSPPPCVNGSCVDVGGIATSNCEAGYDEEFYDNDINELLPSSLLENTHVHTYAEMTIGCIGGSIMAGRGCWGQFSGMPDYLGEILGPEISITNSARGGSKIMAEGLLQIPGQLASLIDKKPEINLILVIGGFNDLYYALVRRDALTTEFVNDLIGAIYNLLYTEITGTGRSALIFTMPKLNGLPWNLDEKGADQFNAAIVTVNEAIEQMVIEINSSLEGQGPVEIIFFDFAQFLEDNPEYYKDHVHLNCEGYSEWASAIAELLLIRINP